MAGTPTQYYGFPTYADSDAVDLTAQYNSAMVMVDGELHKMHTRAEESRTARKIVLFGDSWTDPWNANGFHEWVDELQELIGATSINNYARSGAGFGGDTNLIQSQIDSALDDGCDPDIVVIVGGVNDINKDRRIVSAYSDFVLKCAKTFKRARVLPYYNGLSFRELNETGGWAGLSTVLAINENMVVSGSQISPRALLNIICADGFWETDNFHPNDVGKDLLAKTVAYDIVGLGHYMFKTSTGRPVMDKKNCYVTAKGDVGILANPTITNISELGMPQRNMIIYNMACANTVYPAVFTDGSGRVVINSATGAVTTSGLTTTSNLNMLRFYNNNPH